jgi:predicted O-methyltransferase YrrM
MGRAAAKRLVMLLLSGVARVVAPVVGLLARFEAPTGAFIKHGVLPVPLHYYQPVFDPATIPEAVWTRRHDLPGIDFREDAQLELLRELGRHGDETDWPAERQGDSYYTGSGAFGASSAYLLHAFVRHFAPRRVVEVGAGHSTLIFRGALDMNGAGTLTTIDPNPDERVNRLPVDELIPQPVEGVPIERFTDLDAGDMVFIDSSHVVRMGGDVNYLYLDVLPRLRPGVLVHIHDIQLPYEYPRSYPPRYFWTEQYLLQAFLTHSPRWEVLLGGFMIQRDHPDAFGAAFPHTAGHRATSSFYMRAA